jgi:hypothetical protein
MTKLFEEAIARAEKTTVESMHMAESALMIPRKG